jgi:PAS domain S-box-containing protein
VGNRHRALTGIAEQKARFMNSNKYLQILNKFTFDLIGIQDREELCWYAAREVVGKLGYTDCVIYLIDEPSGALVQRAAAGPKNPHDKAIVNALEIPLGVGITGIVAQSGQACMVNELVGNENYIKDIDLAGSELCVPIGFEDTIFGVIDSEHQSNNHFSARDLEIFSDVARLMGAKLAQLKLVDRDKEHTRIIERMRDIIIVTDKDGLIISVNSNGEKALGYSQSELQNMTFSDLVHYEGNWDEWRHKVIDDMVADGDWSGRLRLKGRDQEIQHYDMRVRATIGKDGEYLGAIGVLRNIDQLVVAERELRRHATIFESVNDAILMFDIHARIIDCNKKAQVMMGRDRAQLIGMTSVEFAADKEEWEQGLKDTLLALAEHGTFIGEGRAKHTSGREFPIEVSMTMYRNQDGMPLGTVAVIRDLTDQRRAEKILQQSQKMEAVGQLASGIAHDFNNILSVVLGNLEMALEPAVEDSEKERFLSLALLGAERGAALNRKLLTFSRPQLTEEIECCVDWVISAQAPLVRSMIGENIVLKTTLDTDDRSCRLDSAMLESVILNLAINARDAMPDGGTLTIETRVISHDQYPGVANLDEPMVHIQISDNGAGMTPEVLKRAIEPFFTTKDVGGGSGLGLSMAFRFAQRLGGRIEIDSEAGKGTDIHILLPSLASEANHDDHRNVVDVPLVADGELVLVVEDQEDVMDIMVHYLDSLGYRIMTATNGVEAIGKIKEAEENIDVVLSDVMMPGGVDGLEVVEMATKTNPHTKFILMSGNPEFNDKADRQDSPNFAKFKLLRKPFGKAELGEAIRLSLHRG